MTECICKGNWRNIVLESEKYLEKRLENSEPSWSGVLVGFLHAEDDYYYYMRTDDGQTRLLSCVGNLESWGYILND